MSYTLSFTRQALKALEKINNPYYDQLKKAISDLCLNPRPVGYKQLNGRDGYRIRVGDYRIIYDIFDDILVVDIIAIGHRKNIYD